MSNKTASLQSCSMLFLNIKSYGFLQLLQVSCFSASIDMVFLELKCTSILLWPCSHPADIKVRSLKSEGRSRKSEVGSRKSEVGSQPSSAFVNSPVFLRQK